jgi:uncharacterized membrane protein YqiK
MMLFATATPAIVIVAAVLILVFLGVLLSLGVRFIPNDRVGIVEKLWSLKGSVDRGNIMAGNGQAGYQADLLRGGLHFFKWHFQYRVHRAPLVTVPQGKIAYVYARGGQPLTASQTLGRVVDCANFQDTAAFLANGGQRGRQRSILREGVYAINLAQFMVITEDSVYQIGADGRAEAQKLLEWQKELAAVRGFDPVVIGAPVTTVDPLNPEKQLHTDSIGIVTVHDGPSLSPGEIIAPAVGQDPTEQNYHNNYQDPEAFLAAGGRRGRQYVPLTDGTYFLNR